MPGKRVAPEVCRAREAGEEASRTRAWTRTGGFCERRVRAVAPPCEPVAPVTRNVGCAIALEKTVTVGLEALAKIKFCVA